MIIGQVGVQSLKIHRREIHIYDTYCICIINYFRDGRFFLQLIISGALRDREISRRDRVRNGCEYERYSRRRDGIYISGDRRCHSHTGWRKNGWLASKTRRRRAGPRSFAERLPLAARFFLPFLITLLLPSPSVASVERVYTEEHEIKRQLLKRGRGYARPWNGYRS